MFVILYTDVPYQLTDTPSSWCGCSAEVGGEKVLLINKTHLATLRKHPHVCGIVIIIILLELSLRGKRFAVKKKMTG